MQINLFDYKVKLAVKGALYTSGMPAVFAGMFRKVVLVKIKCINLSIKDFCTNMIWWIGLT